jgi:hypothetical protein
MAARRLACATRPLLAALRPPTSQSKTPSAGTAAAVGNLFRALGIACLLIMGACQEQASQKTITQVSHQLIVRAPDTSNDCYDLAGEPPGLRVCYSSSLSNKVDLVARTLPSFDASTRLGWRCVGSGAARHCYDRAQDVGAFECSERRCVQEHPRVPDANEWFCSDAHGGQLCLMQAPAAGVSIGKPTAGYVCGNRKIGKQVTGQSLCLDLSPDFPDSDATGWSCHYEGDPSLRRICIKKSVRGLGAQCSQSAGCSLGTVCQSGHCVPGHPKPTCWLDDDCEGRPCRAGSCQ